MLRLLVCSLLSLPVAGQTQLARLEAGIDRITRSVNAEWGIYIKCMETGEEVARNADRQMDTMSVIKIPLMAEAFRQIQAGKFALTDTIKLTEAQKRPGTGILRSLEDGAVITVKDALTLMIIVSDNTATDLIFDKVGGIGPVNDFMKRLGLNSIRATGESELWFKALRAAPSAEEFHRAGKSPYGLASPRDIGKLLEKMERKELVSAAASDQMLQMMRGQVYSSRIPRYLFGYRIPHKTGDFMPYIGNDVGVLEGQSKRIVISIFTAHHYGVGANLEDAIGRIAELVGNYFASK